MPVASTPSSTASCEKRIESTSRPTKATATAMATSPTWVASSELTAAWAMPTTAATDEPTAAAAARPPTLSRTSMATAGVHARARPATGPSRVRNMVPAATRPTPETTTAASPIRLRRTSRHGGKAAAPADGPGQAGTERAPAEHDDERGAARRSARPRCTRRTGPTAPSTSTTARRSERTSTDSPDAGSAAVGWFTGQVSVTDRLDRRSVSRPPRPGRSAEAEGHHLRRAWRSRPARRACRPPPSSSR